PGCRPAPRRCRSQKRCGGRQVQDLGTDGRGLGEGLAVGGWAWSRYGKEGLSGDSPERERKMIRLIEFHVLSSGYPVAINPDAVSKIGVVDWDENGVKTDVRGV